MTCRMYIAILCFRVPVHKIATAKTVVMLLEGTEELSLFENLIHSTATWMSMLVVILKVLFWRAWFMAHFSLTVHASAPRLNYRLLQSYIC